MVSQLRAYFKNPEIESYLMVKDYMFFFKDEEQKNAVHFHFYSTGTVASGQNNYVRKRKITESGKNEIKLSLFADDIILHTEKLSELMKEFSKAAGYKINIHKLIVFLYIYNEPSRKQFHLQQHQKE